MRLVYRERFDAKGLAARIAITVGVNFIYALVFMQLYSIMMDATGSLSIVPTAVGGGLLGLRFGLLSGLFNFLLNEVLYGYFSPTADVWSVQSIPGLIFSVGSSGIVGWLSDLLYQTKVQADQIEQQRRALALEIAQRRQAEDALIQARDKALEASQAKTQLLAKISHELRTPLSAILGYAELLQEGVIGELNNKQKRMASSIAVSADYLNQLISELLDQAQFEATGVKLNLAPFDINELIQQIELRMRVLAESKGLNFQVKIGVDLPEKLIGDQYRLQQIITNLIGNAIKFTETGGVYLHLYHINHSTWAISVSDTGPGIPQEAQTDIFKAFHQVNRALIKNSKGTGLGLSIVKQLVSAMNGHITVESEVGQGSTFTVSLPLKTVMKQAA